MTAARANLVLLPAVVRSSCRRALEQMRSPGHSRLLSGSMIMLAGTTLVSALNFAYNLVTAHLLGPADFGHASVAVTLLMLASAITLSFQLVCAKFVAREATPAGKLRVALLGLAFKPNTDDMREAPSLVLASRLIAEGAEVRGWDPIARPDLQGVELCNSPLEAVTGADAAVIVTEWQELLEFPSEETRQAMRHPLIVDGRNLLDADAVRALGFAYEGVGRTVSPLDVFPETSERDPETSG